MSLFFLASQAHQVFYVDDIKDKDWRVVVKTNPRDLFRMPQRNDDDEGNDHDVLADEEVAYQQVEVDLDMPHNNIIEQVIDIALRRTNVESQSILLEKDPLKRKMQTGANEKDPSIDDDNINNIINEESEEELLDGHITDDTDNHID